MEHRNVNIQLGRIIEKSSALSCNGTSFMQVESGNKRGRTSIIADSHLKTSEFCSHGMKSFAYEIDMDRSNGWSGEP
jgi:hypothetical protein